MTLTAGMSFYPGKKVLLFSFDAGNFVYAADEKKVLTSLRKIDEVRKEAGDELVVIGVTFGTAFIWPGIKETPGEFGKVSQFQIINANLLWEQDPYELLLGLGAILIDKNGVVRWVCSHEPTKDELLSALDLPDWNESVKPAPMEDPWQGKPQPQPRTQLEKSLVRRVGRRPRHDGW